jgi:uncharacterized protein (TIGR02246 family)
MRRSFFALAAGLAGCAPPGKPVEPPVDSAALTRVLTSQFQRSARDWNSGNLDGFVSDYAPDSTTDFLVRGHFQYGFDRIRQGYEAQFAPGAARDSLRFEEMVVRPLGPDYAMVTARYVLYRDGRTTSSGPFTLVMEHRPDGWKILHDHTSSDPQ